MTEELIFVYNADSGKWNGMLDVIHKVVSPETYSCNLCAITYGTLSIKKEWKEFKESELCPCDLSDILNMTVPAISQHLRKLKDGGLVTNKKVGQTVFYSLIKDNREVIPLLESLSVQNQNENYHEI